MRGGSYRMFRGKQRRYAYRKMRSDDPKDVGDSQAVADVSSEDENRHVVRKKVALSRQTYWGSLAWNFLAFLLPALYSTLSKLWVANIDSDLVATTDSYTYMSTIAEVINEGLPRTAWLIIGDTATRSLNSRLSLTFTLITFQMIMGCLLTIIFVGAADAFAASFVPAEVRGASLDYVRISAPVALSSSIQVAVASCTRALDQPDVPLIISSVGFITNIILDLIVISKFHVGSFTPTVLTQAGIRLACDMISAFAGLAYLFILTRRMKNNLLEVSDPEVKIRPSFNALKILCRPAVSTFTESAIRNAIYLWVVSRIIGLGKDYATAWGVFNTIRWGLIMVPVNALQQSSLTFVGHRWSHWHARVDAANRRPAKGSFTWEDLRRIAKPAILSAAIAVAVEVPICIFFSFWGMQRFSYYLSNSEDVADIAAKMWRNIDWCYIFYAITTQFSGILLATVPRWYLFQSLGSNFLWMLPWAIVVTVKNFAEKEAWTYYATIFGGALVFDFANVALVLYLWAWKLLQGRMRLQPVTASI
ncbi:hypothetical protein BJ875DRAFT_177525 [Amylocarpus encephaloides]|uniref:Uncharacterized protein n=1 Tax=Amylocarpus encephaloides TaxID=45428 RepID=A0A9P7YAK1_9HELO|nr:hypothetical protein BJ875DRAFT_177525 [Amylocarpus encephaloides]